MAQFQKKDGGLPFPRSAAEWQEKINPATGMNFTPAQADHIMCKEVFGSGYRINDKGFPIETGRGSAANPVTESAKAAASEKSAAEQAKLRIGWHKGLENAFDPRNG